MPLVTVTAWHMLVTRANVQPGEDVLVHAAGSGVGSIAIQIAKLRGARVITTASSDEKLAKARELGADETINYSRDDWPKEVKRLTDRKWRRCGRRAYRRGNVAGLDQCPQEQRAVSDLRRHQRFRCAHGSATVFYRHLTLLGSFMGSKAELLEAMKFVARERFVRLSIACCHLARHARRMN